MGRWIVAVLFFGAFSLGIGILIAQTPPSAEVAQEEAKNKLRIVAKNWEFDQKTYNVQAGSTLQVELINQQGLHGIEIEGLNISLQGTELAKEVTFDTPGEYKIVCIVLCGEGHVEMVSTIVVA
jgi:cytochrome c oxidase subunit 2